MLKDQIYHIEELPPERKHEFEDKIKAQDLKIADVEKRLNKMAEDNADISQGTDKFKKIDGELHKRIKGHWVLAKGKQYDVMR